MLFHKVTLLVCGALVACNGSKDVQPAKPPPPAASAARVAVLSPPLGYKSGPWWTKDLQDVRQCFAHVLVTFARSNSDFEELKFAGPIAPREREAALELAQSLQRELADHPDRFATLAREKSEDWSSAPFDGVVGCFSGAGLPDGITNALGNLERGQISRVVETPLGFHVIKRLPEPPEEQLSAQRIVIKHAKTRIPGTRSESKSRTREAALELSKEIRRKASDDPDSFPTLVRQYSDGPTSADGDFGQWSYYERGLRPQFMEALRVTPVGSVSAVVEDDYEGFTIFRRTPLRDRPVLARAAIVVRYMGDESSARDAKARAQAILAKVRGAERPFTTPPPGDEGAEYLDVHTFVQGDSGIPDLDTVLPSVPLGKVIDRLFERPGEYLVVRRASPEPLPTTTYTFDLPRPERQDTRTATTAEFTMYLDYFVKAVERAALLSPTQAPVFAESIQSLKTAIQTAAPDDREALVQDTRRQLEASLGHPLAARLAELDRRLQEQLQGSIGPN